MAQNVKCLNPTSHISRGSSVGSALDLESKGCWFEPTVSHYFSDPRDPKSIGFLSLLIIHNLHVKYESDLAKTIVCIVSTMYYTQCQSWPWPMTPLPKINWDPPPIIHNLHVKSESDWAKTIVCIVSIRSYTQCQSWPWPMTPWPKINRVHPPHHPQLTCEDWKWLGYNCSLYHVHTILYTVYQCGPWPLTPWPKINRVPPLIIHNLHMKSESDWAKTGVGIVSTRSYTQSAKVDIDLWYCDLKLIGSLLSSSTTYMWSLKVIGQKL